MINLHRTGYALFEALFAVALVVVLGIAIAPPLMENLREGKIARARAETEFIAQAMVDFHRDVGHWPLTRESEEAPWTRLVGNERVGGGVAAVPTGLALAGAGGVSGDLAVGTMTAHLIRNRDDDGEPLYRSSRHPHLEAGWNGPYLEEVPLDPWGQSYVVSIVSVDANPVEEGSEEAALIVSAGPDGVLQTALDAPVSTNRCAGDDIGLVAHRPERLEY